MLGHHLLGSADQLLVGRNVPGAPPVACNVLPEAIGNDQPEGHTFGMVSFGDVPGQGVRQRWQAGRGFLSVVGAIHAVTVSGAKY